LSSLVSIFTSFIDALYALTNAINFPSYALAIIILGLIVRILLMPLTIMQMKSMLGMSEIQPELQQLQKQYANNREKLSEEMMKLYQEYDVKPAAGCLPILIQMPILYILFWAIRAYDFADAEHANFFWISSLNNTDPTYILPIVLGLIMFVQQKIAMSINPTANDPSNPANMSMKMMLYVMPLMMGFSATMMPSGLVIYWLTTSTFMVFQQLLMNRIRKKELAKRAIEREKRLAERQKELEEEKKKGQNKSKKKTKQQLKNEHKAKKREQAQYQAPSKEGSTATYHAPKKQ
jgi:YidC/Oxa1 family membrane protein insertase